MMDSADTLFVDTSSSLKVWGTDIRSIYCSLDVQAESIFVVEDLLRFRVMWHSIQWLKRKVQEGAFHTTFELLESVLPTILMNYWNGLPSEAQ